MLEDEDYVYFFLREQAVEYINCGKVVMMMMLMVMMLMMMKVDDGDGYLAMKVILLWKL